MSLPPPRPRITPAIEGDGTFTETWAGWFRSVWNVLNPGINASVTLTKLTPGGNNGSITIVKGIVTGYTAPT